MRMVLSFRHESAPSTEDLATVLEIYAESFPPGERSDPGEWVATIGSSRGLATVRSGDRIVGFAVTLQLSGGVVLLEYLAVTAAVRNDGAGGALLDFVKAGQIDAGAAGMLLEVEHPDAGTSDERLLRLRRIDFYGRHGAQSVECAPDYRVPDLVTGELVPMTLLWISSPAGPTSLRGAELAQAVRGVLVGSYGLDPDGETVRANVEGLRC